jgi:TRAP-type C4-dicarboxylate transport system permease small subunit
MVMFNLSHFLIGLLLIACGVVMVKYNFKLVGITGRQDWIEDKLGSGTTYLAYQIFAVALVLIGLAMVSGLSNNLFNTLLSPLKGLFSGVNQS